MADADAFNKKVKLLWLGIGTTEPQRMYESVKNYHEALEKAGIKHVYYESPGTVARVADLAPLPATSSPRCCSRHADRRVGRPRPGRGRPTRQQPIVLNADDVPAFPEPPAGIDAEKDVPHGKLEMVSYDSKSVGTTRKMQRLHAAGLLDREEVPGALPAARHRRRRDRMAALRQARTSCSTT